MDGISAVSASVAWCVGGSTEELTYVILRTTDGGTTWTTQRSGNGLYLYDVHFVDLANGWAVGTFGIILHTSDGGVTWNQQNSDDPHNLFGVHFVDSQTGWVSGDWQTLLHTTNGGTTWTQQSVNAPRALGDVLFLNSTTGWTSGNEGAMFFTTNGGNTWEEQNSGVSIGLNSMSFVGQQDGWVAGGIGGVVVHTTNGGTQWDQQISGTNEQLNGLQFVDLNEGWTVGNSGAIAHTTNGGFSWEPVTGVTEEHLRAIDFVSPTVGWIVGYNGTILFSGGSLAQSGIAYGSTGSGEPTNPGALITIDPVTGDGTLVGSTGIIGNGGPSVPAIAIKSTGEMYAVSTSTNAGLYTVDASTGEGAFVANTGISLPNAMAFDGYDQLYITDGSGMLYTLDETTGIATAIGPLGFNVRGIAFDPTDGTMYGSSGTDGIYTIDPTTATATLLGNTGLGGSTPDIHFDLDGNLFGTKIGGGTIYNYVSINKQTGAGTLIGSTGFTAVIGLSARLVRSDVVPVTIEVGIDPEDQTVPPGGATFPYSMTFTNNTARTQTFEYWTKLTRPIGNPLDPFDGPLSLTLDPFESASIDTNEISVPPNGIPGDYSLIGYVGTYPSDTLDSDTTGFTKLDDSIPCDDIAQFRARCRPGGLIQAKAIFTDFSHVGETVRISVDQFPYDVTVGLNGQATFSQTGFNLGVHTVELTDPPGCFPATTVMCRSGLEKEGEDGWDDPWEIPTTTSLLGNYPNPFNPSTTFRYALAEPGDVTLKVYNMLGQVVKTIVDEQQVEGYHEGLWDGRNEFGATVASGIYIYRMTVGGFVETKRMLLLK